MTQKIVVPQENAAEKTRGVIEAFAGEFPGGSTGVALMRLIAPGFDGRRQQFLEDVADKLQELDERKPLSIDEVVNDSAFLDTVAKTTLAAMATADAELLEALRNAVLNAAIGEAPEETTRLMFLSFLERFSGWHVRVLRLCDHPVFKLFEQPNRKVSTQEETERWYEFVKEVEESLDKVKADPGRFIHKQVLRDLYNSGLLEESIVREVGGPGYQLRAASRLGAEFLKFISDPIARNDHAS